MINLFKNKKGLKLLLFLFTLSGSLILASGSSENSQVQPIKIKFKQFKPPISVKVEEDYVLHVEWKNRDNYRSYNGQFVFKVYLKNENIVISDLEFVYRDQIIEAVKVWDGLEFRLPSQEFLCLDAGYVEVIIQYFTLGEYVWDIAISQN